MAPRVAGKRQKQERAARAADDAEKAKELETILFGKSSDYVADLGNELAAGAVDSEAAADLPPSSEDLITAHFGGEPGGEGGDAEGLVGGEVLLGFIDRKKQRVEEEGKGSKGKKRKGKGLGEAEAEKPAWVDEEDETLVVTIAGQNRLRKLRKEEDEVAVSGVEYQQRLRAQHARLNPGTRWAKVGLGKQQKEKKEKKEKPVTRKEKRDDSVKEKRSNEDAESEEEDEADAGELSDGERGGVFSDLEQERAAMGVGEEEDEEGESEGDEDQDGFDADEILRNMPMLAGQSKDRASQRTTHRLPPGRIRISRVRDANWQAPTGASAVTPVAPSRAIQSLSWHPNGQLLLCGSIDGRVRFVHVDGEENPELQSIYFENVLVRTAAFTADGTQVVVAGRNGRNANRGYATGEAFNGYHVYDIGAGRVARVDGIIGRPKRDPPLTRFALSPDGGKAAFLSRDGFIVLVSLKSRQWMGNLKLNGSVSSVCFAPPVPSDAAAGTDGSDGPSGQALTGEHQMLATGSDGEVYHFDLRMMRCIHRRADDGCVKGTAIAASPDGRHFAAGSDSGVVNLYDRPAFLRSGPFGSISSAEAAVGSGGLSRDSEKPLQRAFMNLTTEIDALSFNHDGRILALSSREQRDSLRLVHVPSRSVFFNWPTERTALQFVHAVEFSPHSGYLAVGNRRGKYVHADDFSPHSGYLAVGNRRGMVLLFQLRHYERAELLLPREKGPLCCS
ncbi:unnamed protein product [Closterium sp. Naga37s-1]|nr:unnamed protein product [Closterium sp. Naga37s-1]